jgi:hypothetical protein
MIARGNFKVALALRSNRGSRAIMFAGETTGVLVTSWDENATLIFAAPAVSAKCLIQSIDMTTTR